MNSKKSYWLISVTALLLLSLLINQLVYVFNAAEAQEAHFNDKAKMALEVIVGKISQDYTVCKSVNDCLYKGGNMSCSKAMNSKKEWTRIDSIIQNELNRFDIKMNYNFDFCKDLTAGPNVINSKNTFTKNVDMTFQKAGFIMYIEFPDKSKYLLREMGSVFISSILIIILITIAFVITFRYYKRERTNAQLIMDFLNNMTHEFKTPLANISLANNMLKRNAEDIKPNKIVEYADIIKAENERLIEHSTDILEFATLENIPQGLSLDHTDMHDLIQEVQDRFTRCISSIEIQIKMDLKAERSLVKGKSSLLFNSLSNIIDNSIKYCEGSPEVSIITRNDRNFLVLEVSDNGIGIPKSDVGSVLNKFFRVSSGDVHDVKGFGLGLAYVQMIIKQLKGKIKLSSNLGQGTTITLFIPTASD